MREGDRDDERRGYERDADGCDSLLSQSVSLWPLSGLHIISSHFSVMNLFLFLKRIINTYVYLYS